MGYLMWNKSQKKNEVILFNPLLRGFESLYFSENERNSPIGVRTHYDFTVQYVNLNVMMTLNIFWNLRIQHFYIILIIIVMH